MVLQVLSLLTKLPVYKYLLIVSNTVGISPTIEIAKLKEIVINILLTCEFLILNKDKVIKTANPRKALAV
jgi:hypothetical protein